VRQYYYVVASLPLLHSDSPPPLDLEELFYSCRGNIQESDLALLMTVSLQPGDPADNAFLKEWYTWESSLRNELVRLRSQKKGVDAEHHLREGDVFPGIPETAREAFTQDSPLVAEELLNRARWSKLEELEVGHYFDMVKLMAYSLKLQLLQRQSRFTTELGKEKFGAVYDQIHEDIQNAEKFGELS